MSTEAKPAEAAPASDVPKKSSLKVSGILAVLLPTIVAAGASYMGTRGAVIKAAAAAPAEHAESTAPKKEAKPPGPTLPLEPFLVSIYDEHKKAHPMKMSLAVEFESGGKESGGEHGGGGDLKEFQPRIRDAILAYLRTLSYEQVSDAAHVEKMRAELVERCQKAGAVRAERILITDFVVQ